MGLRASTLDFHIPADPREILHPAEAGIQDDDYLGKENAAEGRAFNGTKVTVTCHYRGKLTATLTVVTFDEAIIYIAEPT